MVSIVRFLAVFLIIVTPCIGLAADEAKTFGVLRFTVNGPEKYTYLQDGIRDMLVSRLYWKDHFHSVTSSELTTAKTPENKEEAAQQAEKFGLDYILWGSVSIVGEECSLDIQMLGPDKELKTKSLNTQMSKLIPNLDTAAKEISNEVFQRTAEPEPAQEAEQKKEVVHSMNPELVYNEARSDRQYLNQGIDYQGQGAERIRSQTLPFTAYGMVVGDVDGDGANEVILMEKSKVHAYRYRQNRLAPLAEFDISPNLRCLNINLVDINRDDLMEIVITAVRDENDPDSFILNYKDKKFTEYMTDIRLFLGVAHTPPEYMPVLIGQKPRKPGIFDKTVYELMQSEDELIPLKSLPVPSKANVFNFTFLPQEDGYKVVLIDDSDHMNVFSISGESQFEGEEMYAGSAVHLEINQTVRGITARNMLEDLYYIPVRMLAADPDKDGRSELVVQRPISTAAELFERYRHFPQGEVHALIWDGISMNLLWKTRRIKGSISDLGYADLNNDSVQDLCVLINTHSGITGFDTRKTVVLGYPMVQPTESEARQ